MKGYAHSDVFSYSEQVVWKHANNLVEKVPECTVRCHELARALAHHLAWYWSMHFEVIDGQAGPVQHSWILLPAELRLEGRRGQTILDPYAPGRLPMVQLVDPIVQMEMGPGRMRFMYQQGEQRVDVNDDLVRHLMLYFRTPGLEQQSPMPRRLK